LVSAELMIAAQPVTQEHLTACYWSLAPKIKQIYEGLAECERVPSMWFLSIPEDLQLSPLAAPIPAVLVQNVIEPLERRVAFQLDMLHPTRGPRLARSLGLTLSQHPNAILMGAMAWATTVDEFIDAGGTRVVGAFARRETFVFSLRAHDLKPLVAAWPVKRQSDQRIEIVLAPPLEGVPQNATRAPGETLH
jgi:hypothetical protein